MSETKITDLVPQETIDKIKELNAEIQGLLTTYTDTAKDLAKGLEINVKVIGDIDKLNELFATKSRESIQTTEKLNKAMSEQRQIIADTTNTRSRQLMEQERVNKTQREAYTEYDRVKKLLDQYHDTYANQLQSLVRIGSALEQNKKAQKDNEKELSAGRISVEQYTEKQIELVAAHRSLTQEKRTLSQIMTAEEKAAQSQEQSYIQMSQQLELLKKAYGDLSAEGRKNDFGKELEASIQSLGEHLKDISADMGDFHRNVGNYAIAGQQGIVTTDSVIAAINQEARTMQDLIDQTKILEEAKLMLNKEDANYKSTLDSLNAKIEENKRKLTDVSDILHKGATSVAEAEAQNKRLSEALKHVDVNAEGAAETIKAYRDKIDENNEVINRVTGSNEEYAESVLSIIGINADFGKSLESLTNSGSHDFIDGLNTKIKALGNTLLGILSNPWVLTLLGIAGVTAGVKWWYDFNKGLVEATKLTKDFTGFTGDALKSVRNEVQAVSDKYGKDFRETLEAANALSKQFGISFQYSMELVKDGFIAGADVNGEFIENIKEYPAYFKEAGLSASEFIAITTQANQAGIYSDKGIDVIKEGNLRIREMTKATAEALDAIGISSKEAQKALADGSKTTFDIMQEVSEKLAEFPEASTEVGTALADIFGGPGEDAGLQYILTLKDIDTNLDNVKNKAGELGALEEKQFESQIELQNAITSVFDMTGGAFESLTTNAEIFINKGLVKIIEGCAGVYNWFVRVYNGSYKVKTGIEAWAFAMKAIWTVIKNVCAAIADEFKGIGQILEGVLTISPQKIMDGIETVKKGYKDAAVSIAEDIADAFGEGIENIKNKKLNEISVNLKPEVSDSSNDSKKAPGKIDYTITETDEEKKAREKAAKEAEKQAKEELKRLNELEESKISVMAEGHEKELAKIRLNFKKKIDEIRGQSETENALRIQLTEQCQQEISECELKYQKNLAKINLENRLASVEKGSKEELDLKLAQIEASRVTELKEAEKTGADVNLIHEKFNKEREKIENEHAAGLAQKIQERYANEQANRDNNMAAEINQLQKEYAKELAVVSDNEAKRNELKERYENKSAEISEKYAVQSAKASVKMLEEILANDNLSAEEREKLERDLTAAKIALEKSVTDTVIAENERKVKSDNDATAKRIANAQQWMQVASDSLNAINGLVSAVYDAKISKVEEEQEANTAAGEKEQERISQLVEQNVITEEEGEARKRAAEEQTAKKNEELEKKKAQIKYRQAVFDKAISIANIGLNTAMAMMQLWVKPGWPAAIPMMAVVGALSAIQLATALATPIPKYAQGTDRHKGGPAIVGDGGMPELVIFGGKSWITPDTPTLVNLPEGASVIPNVIEYVGDTLSPSELSRISETPNVIVNNNYKKLEDKLDRVIYLFRISNNARRENETSKYLELIKLQKGL